MQHNRINDLRRRVWTNKLIYKMSKTFVNDLLRVDFHKYLCGRHFECLHTLSQEYF